MTSQSWAFHNPTRVRFGRGCREAVLGQLPAGPVLVVATRRGRGQLESDPILSRLGATTELAWVDTIEANPGLADVQAEIDRLSGGTFGSVLAFGGGSALDAAKGLSMALGKSVATRNLRELIADPRTQEGSTPLPLHALPTTSGTGSEVTPFATIWDHAAKKKLSLAGPKVAPYAAYVDPDLTDELPAEPTFSTGLDALNQALESVWNRNASPATLPLAAQAVGLALAALPVLHRDLHDRPAREAIAQASLLAGLCISQTRTAICHSVSYPMTAHFGVSHGYACAFTMGAVADMVGHSAPERLDPVGRMAGLGDGQGLRQALHDLLDQLDVRAGVTRFLPGLDALLALTGEMVTPGRADNFILPIDTEALNSILRNSFGTH